MEKCTRKNANVLLICIDALRSDHVGAYGYRGSTTPSVDALAQSGVVFESAFSSAAWTKPSVPSYMTGRFPHQHGVYSGAREEGGKLVSDVLSPEEHTLAELFQAAGFQTVAVVANPVISGAFGNSQGFDDYFFSEKEQEAEHIRERFLAWIDGADPDSPFFAYLHFNDAHLPYDPPGEYRRDSVGGKAEVDFSSPSWQVLKRRIRQGKIRVSKEDRRRMIDLYDGEIGYADAQIGEVLAGLENKGLLGHTLIVVLADHGEEFLEHGGVDHGASLYDEVLRVPLIFRFPEAKPAGVRVSQAVSLVDVVPTVSDAFGMEPPAGIAGRSMLGLVSGQPAMSQVPIYAEGIHPGSRYQQAIRLGEWKYIVTVRWVKEGGARDRGNSCPD